MQRRMQTTGDRNILLRLTKESLNGGALQRQRLETRLFLFPLLSEPRADFWQDLYVVHLGSRYPNLAGPESSRWYHYGPRIAKCCFTFTIHRRWSDDSKKGPQKSRSLITGNCLLDNKYCAASRLHRYDDLWMASQRGMRKRGGFWGATRSWCRDGEPCSIKMFVLQSLVAASRADTLGATLKRGPRNKLMVLCLQQWSSQQNSKPPITR